MQLLMWRGTKARGDAWRIIRFCVWGGVRAVHRCEYTRYCPHLTTHEVVSRCGLHHQQQPKNQNYSYARPRRVLGMGYSIK